MFSHEHEHSLDAAIVYKHTHTRGDEFTIDR